MAICKNCGVDHANENRASVTVQIGPHKKFDALAIRIEAAVPRPFEGTEAEMQAFSDRFVKEVQELFQKHFKLPKEGAISTRNKERIFDREESLRNIKEKWNQLPPSVQSLLTKLGMTPDEAGAARVVDLGLFDIDGDVIH